MKRVDKLDRFEFEVKLPAASCSDTESSLEVIEQNDSEGSLHIPEVKLHEEAVDMKLFFLDSQLRKYSALNSSVSEEETLRAVDSLAMPAKFELPEDPLAFLDDILNTL